MDIWQDHPDTSLAALDDDHRALHEQFRQVAHFVGKGNLSGTSFALNVLLDSLAEHFTQEQQQMTDTDYPAAERHAAAHQSFLVDVRRHLADLGRDGLSSEFRAWASEKILEWFRFHSLASDTALREYLASRPDTVSPALLDTQILPMGG
jgi:hemerythrin-like metal-binding protein